MEGSFLPLDIYENIIQFMDWNTLKQFQKINTFTYFLSKKEIKLREKSEIPFGEINSKIYLVTNDSNLEKIFVKIDKTKYYIPPNKYFLKWVRKLLEDWFVYSFDSHTWILTFKIMNSIIRLNSKYPNLNLDLDKKILVFSKGNLKKII
jgi:hypothetical protein